MDMKMNEQGRQSMGRQNYWLGSTQRFFKAANGKTELRVEKPAELVFLLLSVLFFSLSFFPDLLCAKKDGIFDSFGFCEKRILTLTSNDNFYVISFDCNTTDAEV